MLTHKICILAIHRGIYRLSTLCKFIYSRTRFSNSFNLLLPSSSLTLCLKHSLSFSCTLFTLSPFICLGCFKQLKLSCFLWSDNFEQSSWNHCLSCLLNYVDTLWHKFYLPRFQPTMMAKFTSLFSEAENIFIFQWDSLFIPRPRLLTFWDHVTSHQILQRSLACWQRVCPYLLKSRPVW